MEIIKKGMLPRERTAEFGCHDCGSILKAKASEGERYFSPKNESFIVFKCPICTNKIYVDSSCFDFYV